MNRKEFLAELDLALASLPEEERRNALLYYNEYLDDAGVENEHEAITQLGSVKEIAARINAEFAIKEMEENPISPKKGFSAIWIVVLAILSAPLTIPLAACVVAVFLSIVAVAISVVVAFWAAAIGCVVGGIATLILPFLTGVTPWSSVVLVIGCGVLALGVGILLVLLSFWISYILGKGVAALGRSLIARQDKRKIRKNKAKAPGAPEKDEYSEEPEEDGNEENNN